MIHVNQMQLGDIVYDPSKKIYHKIDRYDFFNSVRKDESNDIAEVSMLPKTILPYEAVQLNVDFFVFNFEPSITDDGITFLSDDQSLNKVLDLMCVTEKGVYMFSTIRFIYVHQFQQFLRSLGFIDIANKLSVPERHARTIEAIKKEIESEDDKFDRLKKKEEPMRKPTKKGRRKSA